MKKNVFFLILIFLGICTPSLAEIFKITNLNLAETKLQAKDKKTGQFLWKSTLAVKKINYQGKPAIFSKETGAGIYGADKKKLNWTSESHYFLEEGRLVPFQSKIIFQDEKGKTIKTLEKSFNLKSKKVTCSLIRQKRWFDTRVDLIGIEVIGLALSNYPFEEKRDFVFYLLTNEPRVYKMTLKFCGRETINVSGTEFPAYKLEMIPDLGALGIFGAFVPKTYFWFKTTRPHQFLRYEGLESGLGTPYIVEEISTR